MKQIRHMSTNIEGMLRHFKGKKITFMEDDNGKPLTDKEAREEIARLQALGHKLIPSGNCEGFDPFGGGCPGHPVEEPSTLIASPGEGAVVVEEKGCRTCRRGEFLPVPGICDICFASSFWEPKPLPESKPKEPSRGIVAEDSTDALMEQLRKSEIN